MLRMIDEAIGQRVMHESPCAATDEAAVRRLPLVRVLGSDIAVRFELGIRSMRRSGLELRAFEGWRGCS